MKEDFAFAYHPQKTGLAPAMGYLIRCEETLKKIYYVTSQRNTMALPTINVHIVTDYSAYDENLSPHKNCKTCKNTKKTMKRMSSPTTLTATTRKHRRAMRMRTMSKTKKKPQVVER